MPSRSTPPKETKKQAEAEANQADGQHALLRDPAQGMHPVSLMTGYYGSRGERIRHEVYEGALRLPETSLEIMTVVDDEGETKEEQQPVEGSKKKGTKKHVLPGLDSVQRPSVELDERVVTKVYGTVIPGDPMLGTPSTFRTIAQNQMVHKPKPPTQEEPDRIRGGGDGDTPAEDKQSGDGGASPMDVDSPQAASGTETAAAALQVLAGASAQSQSQPMDTTGSTEAVAPSKPAAAAPGGGVPPSDTTTAASSKPATLEAETQGQAESTSTPTTGSAPTEGSTTAPPMETKPAAAVPTNVATSTTSEPQTAAPPPSSAKETPPVESASSEKANEQEAAPKQPEETSAAPTDSAQAAKDISAPAAQSTTITTSGSQPPVPQPGPTTTGATDPTGVAAGVSQAGAPALTVAADSTKETSTADAPPSASTVTSGSQAAAAPQPAAPPAPPQVIPLKKRPAPQWSQHQLGPHDENPIDPANQLPKPDWYKADQVSDLERTVLPEWFDGSAPHRTEKSYLQARENIIKMSKSLANRYLTSTMVRRSIPGDVGSLLRLFNFLLSSSLINQDAQNDSAPTPFALLEPANKKQRAGTGAVEWNEDLRDVLVKAVVEQSEQRPSEDAESASSDLRPIDWDAVATKVGQGATATQCERQFLAMPLMREGSVTPDHLPSGDGALKSADDDSTSKAKSEIQKEVYQELASTVDSKVIHAVTEAATKATSNLAEAQKASVFGLVVSEATRDAQAKEEAVGKIMSEIVDLRMKKLENRMTLMNDIEGMLEAERVALELERRDLYTARCRHWFGGP